MAKQYAEGEVVLEPPKPVEGIESVQVAGSQKHLRILLDQRLSRVWNLVDTTRRMTGGEEAGIVAVLMEEHSWLRDFREELRCLGVI